MESQSPFLAMQRLEGQVKAVLRAADTDLLGPEEKKALASVRRLATDARLDIRDYELSETRDEQLRKAAAAKKRLEKLEKAILAAGTSFGPADVAQLDAQLQQIAGRLV